jgi:microcystin-dependent protein
VSIGQIQTEQDLDDFMRQRLNLPGNLQQAIQVAVADATVPTGVLSPFAGASPPAGYLLCDGSEVSRATYSALYAVVGDTYGAGDGTSTFNLPDLRGRAIYGVGTHADLNALGDADALAVADRTPAQSYAHTHTFTTANAGFDNVAVAAGGAALAALASHQYTGTTDAASPAGTDAASVPHIALNYLIKV